MVSTLINSYVRTPANGLLNPKSGGPLTACALQ